MIGTLLIWIYVTIVALIVGFGLIILIEKVTKYPIKDIEVIWVLGVLGITAYAEYFSLFFKVGMWANIILMLCCTTILLIARKEIGKYLQDKMVYVKDTYSKRTLLLYTITLLIFGILFLGLTCQKARHADTDLYHAQTIRWIEEYGVVKGLGNLHHRFAYNSAFLCLQALFSGAFVLGQSTHVLNGYIAFCMFSYIILCILNTKKFSRTFFLEIAVLFYVFDKETLGRLSSPNTDTLALLLVLFVLIKWCQWWEENEQNIVPYAMLCIIGLFAISVKLSTAMILLLVLKPAVYLAKNKRWKEISFWIFLGIVIIAPFLMRNVVISGYLIYPYSSIDLFNVDWKMVKSVVDYDRKEILVWGRGLDDYNLSNYKFYQWFPIWWNLQTMFIKMMLCVNVLAICWFTCNIFAKIKKRLVNWDGVLIWSTGSVLLLFWLLTAPSVRFGRAFIFILPCLMFGEMLGRRREWILKTQYAMRLIIGIGVLITLVPAVAKYSDEIMLKRPPYYIYRECEAVRWEEITMYVGIENCYCGYYFFPATPYINLLEYIELRGKTIEEGFKVRDDVRNLAFNGMGRIYEGN